jgi:hypothetical protein
MGASDKIADRKYGRLAEEPTEVGIKEHMKTEMPPEMATVLKLVLSKPVTKRDVAEAMGWTEQEAYNMLKRLRDTRKLISSGEKGKRKIVYFTGPKVEAIEQRPMRICNGTSQGDLVLSMPSPYRAGSMDAYNLRSKGF